MTELDKLEKYLKEYDYTYDRIDEENSNGLNRHQIIVYEKNGGKERSWDAICHYGSYGYEQGLLEVMGSDVTELDVEGYLTADEIIKRLGKGEING